MHASNNEVPSKGDAIITIERILRQIKPLLANQHPIVQGAVALELTALWLAGHPDFVREELLEAHIACVRPMVQEAEIDLFGDDGHPFNHEGKTEN